MQHPQSSQTARHLLRYVFLLIVVIACPALADREAGEQMQGWLDESKELADDGKFEKAADLRAQFLDLFPQGHDEPYRNEAIGEFWGIARNSSLKKGGWPSVIAWYEQAGKYDKLIAAYEKVLRDPYHIFRTWERARHEQDIEAYRQKLGHVHFENLTAQDGFYVDPTAEASFDIVNLTAAAVELSPGYSVRNGSGEVVAKGAGGRVSIEAMSRETVTFKPGVTEPGRYTLEVNAAGEHTISTPFAFVAKSNPLPLPAEGSIISLDAAVLIEGAQRSGAAIRFPGKAHFQFDVQEDGSAFYLKLDTRMSEPYERTIWNIWIDGRWQTPSNMHGSGPVQFVHTDMRPDEKGAATTSYWRVPMRLSKGTHTFELELTPGQELLGLELVPALIDKVQVSGVQCAAPFGMFYPDEPIDLTLTLENLTDQPMKLTGDALFGLFRQRDLGGWNKGNNIGKLSQAKTLSFGPISPIALDAKATHDIPIDFEPEMIGHVGVTYFLRNDEGLYIAGGADYARIFEPVAGPRENSMFFCEMREAKQVEFGSRLGFKWGRWIGDKSLEAAKRLGIYNVAIIFGMPNELRPGGKRVGTDYLPADGASLQVAQQVTELLEKQGGIVKAINVFNEPWEGKTYWGYGSRGEHYRQYLRQIAVAAKQYDPSIQIIGNDDSHNIRWNLLAEPGMERYVDGASVHYGGIARQEAPYFRSLGMDVFNTEYWFAERVDDTHIVTEYMLHYLHGYRMVNSFIPFHGKFRSGSVRPRSRAVSQDGKVKYEALGEELYDVGSNVPVLSATIHFLEDTDFVEVLTPNTRPWVFTFKGRLTKDGKNTAVLLDSLGAGMPGWQGSGRWDYFQEQRSLRAYVPQEELPTPGQLVISDPDGMLAAYDLLGNPTGRREGGNLVVTVSEDPIYLTHEGSYESFTKVLGEAETRKHRPYDLTLHDFTRPINLGAEFTVDVLNAYPQPLPEGTLYIEAPEGVEMERAKLAIPALQPGESATLRVAVQSAKPNDRNEYDFTATAESAVGERAVLRETLSVSAAVYASIKVDGKIDDWSGAGAIRQFMTQEGGSAGDTTYDVQNPFEQLQAGGRDFFGEFATAWDDDFFYVMARVHDPTHTWQISNFKDTDRYLFFPYPGDHVYRSSGNPAFVHPRGLYVNMQAIEKGEGYQRYPEDVYDPTDWRYRVGMFRNTDYDFIFYDTRFGGEMLQSRNDEFYFIHPGPASPDFLRLNTQVPDGKVVVNHDPERDIVIYEAAIPWSNLAALKPEAGRTFKLGWMIRQNLKDRLSWTTGRSVSVLNAAAFEPEFMTSWSIETDWGLYKPE